MVDVIVLRLLSNKRYTHVVDSNFFFSNLYRKKIHTSKCARKKKQKKKHTRNHM